MEPLGSQLIHYNLAAIFAVLAWMLHKAVKKLDEHEHTRVKANLCFDDLIKREPAMLRIYKALMGRNLNGG